MIRGLFILTLIIPILGGTLLKDRMISVIHTETGVTIDTVGNTILLININDQPIGYISKIFTPVCNTGECLPIHINMCWNLAGEYQRFDMPGGEILTKLDHEPFTQADYDLLQEILIGDDPRYISQVKHSDVSEGAKHNESAPAPTASTFKEATELLDAISGSTIVQVENKFVPGALYTTHTLYGLANDHRHLMCRHTKENLLVPKNMNHLLTCDSCGVIQLAINHLSESKSGPDARLQTLLAIIDTIEDRRAPHLLNQFRYPELSQELTHKAFRNKINDSNNETLIVAVLRKWNETSIYTDDLIFCVDMFSRHPDISSTLLFVLRKQYWADNVALKLNETLKSDLNEELKSEIFGLLKARKDNLERKTWKAIKKIGKSQGLN